MNNIQALDNLITDLEALDNAVYQLRQSAIQVKETLLFPEDHNQAEIQQSQLMAMSAYNEFQTQLGVYSDH